MQAFCGFRKSKKEELSFCRECSGRWAIVLRGTSSFTETQVKRKLKPACLVLFLHREEGTLRSC